MQQVGNFSLAQQLLDFWGGYWYEYIGQHWDICNN